MSITVTARGRIVRAPDVCSTDRGPMTNFMLGTRQFGVHDGVEYELGDLPVVEVCCRETHLAQRALTGLAVDLPVVVVGTLRLAQPLEYYGERELVYVAIDASIDILRQDAAEPPGTQGHPSRPWRPSLSKARARLAAMWSPWSGAHEEDEQA